MLQFMGFARSWTLLSDWTELIIILHKISIRLAEKFFQFYSCYSLLSNPIDTQTQFLVRVYTQMNIYCKSPQNKNICSCYSNVNLWGRAIKIEVGFYRVAIPAFFILMLVKTVSSFWQISSIFPLMFKLCCMYFYKGISSVQSLSRVRLCDPMDCSMPGLSVHHQLPELAQTYVNRVGDAIQLSHPLSSPSPPTFNLS